MAEELEQPVLDNESIEGFGEGAAADAAPGSISQATPPDSPAKPAPAPPSPKREEPPQAATPETETDPIAEASAKAEQLRQKAEQQRNEENERLLQAEAEKLRAEHAAAAQPHGVDLKKTLDEFEAHVEKNGLKFTSPDPDNKEPISFKQLREEYPYMAEMIAAMSQFQSGRAVDPIRQQIERERAIHEYQSYVSALEDPQGVAKLPKGSVNQLVNHADFNKFFTEEQPALSGLINSSDPEHVALALRAFAKAKGITLAADAPAVDPAEKERIDAAKANAERSRSHRNAVHSGSPRGASDRRPVVLDPEEEAAEGFAEGAAEK